METFKRSDINVRAGTLECIFLFESTANNDDLIHGAAARSLSDKKSARSALFSSRATGSDHDVGSGTELSSIILRMDA